MRKEIKRIGLVLIIVSLLLLIVSCTPAQKNEGINTQPKVENTNTPPVAEQPAATAPSPTATNQLKAGECLKITLLPYNENAVQSRVNRKIVCESVSCKFGDPQTMAPFNPEDDTCFGDKMTGCPKVAFYAFEGSVYQAGRKDLCESVSGCVYKQGKSASQDTCLEQ